MAGITQTVPSLTSGISEQPDHLKFQGQVRDVVNAIPDVTYGLFKRPGSKRIDTSQITDTNRTVSTNEGYLKNVQSGGAFFHYYRDESEGSYIGQVDSTGQLRVWRCSDGRLMDTVYGTGGQTALTNYLTTSEPENLQFLTINDTTFVTNRDSSNANTVVGETGLTFDRPEPHCAMIELIRTENGRQYGLNIFDSTSTGNLTTVKRATKVKITGNSFYEGDGSGHCPGIGTEVYSVTAKSSYGSTENISHVKDSSGTTITSDKNNLNFRVTALGQQGISPNYSAGSNGPGGSNYRCSYNLEVVLLHGGEGWEVGDVVRVVPAHATAANNGSQGYIDVSVTEIETTQVKATLTTNGDGLVRPSPTPFDADTAVTADTILAGMVSALPTGVSAKVIGPGIYLSSNNPFNVEIVEEDLMRVFQKSVNDVANLPNQCRHGYIVKVANSRMSDEDDYYLQFRGENNLDGTGSWVECALPNITKTLTNMPLVIQRTSATEFTVRQFDYAERAVGDTITNPMPTFVGKRINKVLFFRNRLAILSGENVVLSRPGSLGQPDFFIETALTVSASDPIDISAASMFPSEIYDGIEINAGLLVFSSNQQFLLSTDDTVLNPDTAKLRSVSTFNYNIDVPPLSLGTTIAYIDNSGKYSRMNEMANTGREAEPNVVEISKLVPSLLPKDIDLLTNSRENSIILASKAGTDIVYGYKYFVVGEKKQQQAWFKWKLNNNLKYHFIINDDYFFLDEDNFLQTVKLIQSENDPAIVQDEINYLLHVDNYTTVSGGVHDTHQNITTFSGVAWLPSVTTPNYDLVILDTDSSATRVGRYAKPTVSGTTFTVPGDWSGQTLTVGYLYEYLVEFPRIYPVRVQGEVQRADVNSSLVVHRLKLHFGKVGLYETTIKRVGKNDYTEIYESTVLDEYDVSDAPYLPEYIKTIPVYEKNKNVDIFLKSSHPAPATLRAMAWEGDFSPMFYRRA